MFKLISSQNIKTLGVTLEHYQHTRLNTMHYHLKCDDSNNTFWVNLSTIPTDSTGVAHILEHLALCGSERFPVRDPFFMMYRRSMADMNAMTSSDWTAYYFSTPNQKDFNNLLDVYLDAVFFPTLDEDDFKQEGWRLEFEKADDVSSNLCYKGVVYNEMKGALSSSVSRLHNVLGSALFPTTTYRFESGGDPAVIPELTYQELKAFHATHYHPSNATFYTYGDMPASHHQKAIDQHVCARFDKAENPLRVPKELTFSQPLDSHATYAVSATKDEVDGTFHVFSWVLCDVADFHQRLSMILMSSILIKNSACPLLNAIETSGLGSAPYCHWIDYWGRQMTFVCGIKGSQPDKRADFEKLVWSTLEKVVQEGIDPDLITNTLHQFELSQRSISDNQGKSLIYMLNGPAVHSADIGELIDLDAGLRWLRKSVQQPRFIENLIQTHLLDNRHRVYLTYQPSYDQFVSEQAHHIERLKKIKSSLSTDACQALVTQAKALQLRQEAIQDPNVLPKLALDDVVDKKPISGEIEESTYHGYRILVCAKETNGLAYVDWYWTLSGLSYDEVALLPILSLLIGDLGSGQLSYQDALKWQDQVSSGIGSDLNINGNPQSIDQFCVELCVSTHGLIQNMDQMIDMLWSYMQNMHFKEQARVQECLEKSLAYCQDAFSHRGSHYAISVASRPLSLKGQVSDLFNGSSFLMNLETIVQNKQWSDLCENLTRLLSKIKSCSQHMFLVAPEDAARKGESMLKSVVGKTQLDALEGDQRLMSEPVSQVFDNTYLINADVNFVARCMRTIPLVHPDSAALSVLAKCMTNQYIHRAVREQGGAYGGGASYNDYGGEFYFYSYRDPHHSQTLKVFEDAVKWGSQFSFESYMFDEAKINLIGRLDKPMSPYAQACYLLWQKKFGFSQDILDTYRQHVIGVNEVAVKRVLGDYLNRPSSDALLVRQSDAKAFKQAKSLFIS